MQRTPIAMALFLFISISSQSGNAASPSDPIYVYYVDAEGRLFRYKYNKTEGPTPLQPKHVYKKRDGHWFSNNPAFDFSGFLSNLDSQEALATQKKDQEIDAKKERDNSRSEKPPPEAKPTSRTFLAIVLTAIAIPFVLLWEAIKYLWNILADYWQIVIPAGLGGILFKWYSGKRKQRQMRIVLAGDPAVGKTALWRALNKDPERTGHKSSVIPSESKLDSITINGTEFFPALHDTPGKTPGDVINALNLRNPLSDKAGFWYRSILVFVVAPNNEENNNSTNASFVSEQLGTLRTFLNMIFSTNSLPKPDGIVLFINKSDIYQDGGNSISDSTLEQTRRIFSDHVLYFDNVTKRNNIRAQVICGSALRGWETRELTNVIARMMQ